MTNDYVFTSYGLSRKKNNKDTKTAKNTNGMFASTTKINDSILASTLNICTKRHARAYMLPPRL